MHYNKIKFILFFVFINLALCQALFNRWVGSDQFIGSSKSTGMGKTHIFNSQGSFNARFNPAKLGSIKSKYEFNLQVNNSSIFERWSMPVRDSFGEFLTNADYVANEFKYYNLHSGFYYSLSNIVGLNIGLALHISPLTNFKYSYSEEVRGSYRIEDGEYASKDPIVGYQSINITGTPILYSLGSGIKINLLNDININLGGAVNIVNDIKISDEIRVDTLYSDVTNLSKIPTINLNQSLPMNQFISLSTTMTNFIPNLSFGLSWENKMGTTSTELSSIDTTNGLFVFWKLDESDSLVYAVNEFKYIKPEVRSLAINYLASNYNGITISFELNQVIYNNHLNLNNYNKYKFGFEYITLKNNSIRAGLIYSQSKIRVVQPTSEFTFGASKNIQDFSIDFSGTYLYNSFNYPDLFPVKDDIRIDYDLVRDSQMNFQFGLSYKF